MNSIKTCKNEKFENIHAKIQTENLEKQAFFQKCPKCLSWKSILLKIEQVKLVNLQIYMHHNWFSVILSKQKQFFLKNTWICSFFEHVKSIFFTFYMFSSISLSPQYLRICEKSETPLKFWSQIVYD